jgi:hypothetical protein
MRMGIIGDWDHPYLTMDFAFEADIVRTLGRIIERGHLHKGSSRCTGAWTAVPPWPRPRWSTRTRPPRRSMWRFR